MECEEFFKLVIDADEPPDPSRRAEIETHRQTCPRCKRLEDNVPKILVALPRELPEPPPPAFRARVVSEAKKALEDDRPEHDKASRNGKSGGGWGSPGRLLATVLVSLLVGAAGYGALSNNQRAQEQPQRSLETASEKPTPAPPEKPTPAPAGKTSDGTKTGRDEFPGGVVPSGEPQLGGNKALEDAANKMLREKLREPLLKALAHDQELAKRPEGAADAHLAAAQILVFLERINEAKKEAQAVVDDQAATPDQKKEAQAILTRR